MAGRSSRFFNAGYAKPKYMLDLQGKSVFAHALSSFKSYFARDNILIICRGDFGTPEFICTECKKLGLANSNFDMAVLTHETAGQAETVAIGLRMVEVEPKEKLTIFNIDTFRPNFQHPTKLDLDSIDGYVEVFQGTGEHWSFVKPDANDPGSYRALKVTEKVRISNLCSTGLYYFREVDLFQKLYNQIAHR